MTANNAVNFPRPGSNGELIIGATGSRPLIGTLTQPATGLTITNGAGSITFALADELAGLQGITGTGMVARTAVGTYATRTLTAGSSAISITNGSGVSGNPTIDVSAGNIDINSLTGYPLTVAHGGTSATTLGNHSVLVGAGTSAITSLTAATNGQVLIGSTGADPVFNSMAQPAAGLTITGGAGSVTFALADDLAAVEALSTTGLATRTGTSAWTTRTITAGSAAVTVTNGDGVSGNPTIDVSLSNIDINSLTGYPLTVAHGGTSATTLGNHSVLVGAGTSAITSLTAATNGQVLIGSTGADPVFNSMAQPAAGLTITGGAGSVTFALADDLAAIEALSTTGLAVRTGTSTWTTRSVVAGSTKITVTNGDGVAGNITIDAAEGVTWTEVTGTSATIAVNSGVIANNASLVTLTLPTSSNQGDEIRVTGKGAGGWLIAQNSGQQIQFIKSVTSTTTGVGGSLASTNQFDSIHLVCVTANNIWNVLSCVGNITVV